jgi:hypothetical protein
VGGKVAVGIALALQVAGQKIKVQCLFRRDAQPVGVVVRRQTGEAPDGIEGEVYGVELDMGQRVQPNGATLDGAHGASQERDGRHKLGAGWPSWDLA